MEYDWLTVLQGIFILIVLYLYYFYKYSEYSYWSRRGVKGPTPFPIFGNVPSLIGRHSFDVHRDWYKKYGRLFGYYEGKYPVLAIGDPELIHRILVKDSESFINHFPPGSPIGHKVLDDNIVFTDGGRWKRIRVLFQSAFTGTRINKTIPHIREALERNVLKLKMEVGGLGGKMVEVNHFLGVLSLDMVCKAFFKANYKPEDEGRLVEASRAFFGRTTFNHILHTAFGNLFTNPPFFTKSAVDVTAKACQEMFEKRRQDPKRGTYEDYSDRMLELGMSADTRKSLSEDEIIAQSALALASAENFREMLTFFLFNLARNPEVQNRLYEEIRGNSTDIELVRRLPYLDAFVKESMRICPPDVFFVRSCAANYRLPGTDIVIPKDMSVSISVLGLHTDPEYFPEPHLFRPERFLNNEVLPNTYIPFGIGQRACMGLNFSKVALLVMLAGLVENFEFSNAEDMKFSYQHLITFSPVRAMMKVKRRN